MKTKSITRLIFSIVLFSVYPSLYAQNIIKTVHPVAYTIKVPGTILNNGFYSQERIIPVEQLSKDDYIPNQIHLKLKVAAKDKFLPGNMIQTDPLLLSIKKINSTDIHGIDNGIRLSDSKDIYGVKRIYEITYAADIDPYDVCRDLMKNPDVEYAVPVFKRYIDAFTPNDPQYASQWALTKIKASEAWDISKGDTSILIAIVDNGTDWQHTDLAANIWNNPREIPNNGIDDDTSGKIDDIHGWDFVGNATATDISQGNWKEDNNPKNPSQQHGTHTAGCASAVTNNGTGISSIGYNCRILPIKCGTEVSGLSGIYRGYTAILYAAQMGADIISCSWGGPGFSPAEEDIIRQVTEMGSLVVAASGNDGKNTDISAHYPSCYDLLLNVGSTGSADGFSSTSNFGSKVTVYAPGENILSTYPNNTYSSQTGTSMACPIAAGLAGLVKSVHPDWKPAQIIQQMRVTCDNTLPSANQSLRYLYWGRINALKALQYNNINFPASTLPGINVYSFALSGTDALKNYDPVNVRLQLRNLLAPVDSVLVSVQALSNYISVSKKDFWVYQMGTMDTGFIDLGIQLLSNNPWFNGKADLQITYSANGYNDIQVIQIPIDINTNNIFKSKGSINTAIYPQWNGISAPDKETCWGVASTQLAGSIYFRYAYLAFTANYIKNGLNNITDPVYCVHGFDEFNAIAGTGKSYVLKTTNAGGDWSIIYVSSITAFVNALLFQDKDTGLLLGDPKNNRWGIGLTTDKGLNWSIINNVPAPLTNESGYVESVYQDYKSVWFGTSAGRIFFSPDFGKNWRATTVFSGGTVVRMAFYDTLHGIAAYTETGGTNQTLYLANTSDGGNTWNKKVMNLTANGLYPLSMYCLPHTKRILISYSNGNVMTTANLGQTWEPVLSQQSIYYEAVKTMAQGKSVRLWEAGDYINTLDFDYEYDSGMTSLSPVYNSDFNINVFPVPASDIIHIYCIPDKNEVFDITLLDVTGKMSRQIFKGRTSGGYREFSIGVSDLTPGIYFVKYQSEKTIRSVPVVISK
jgi:subtilisin family serine protease/photosystem II stability/assembly factor-like uncharacterized protein